MLSTISSVIGELNIAQAIYFNFQVSMFGSKSSSVKNICEVASFTSLFRDDSVDIFVVCDIRRVSCKGKLFSDFNFFK